MYFPSPPEPSAVPHDPTPHPRPALAEMSKFTIIPETHELHPYSNPLMVPVPLSPNPGTSPKTALISVECPTQSVTSSKAPSLFFLNHFKVTVFQTKHPGTWSNRSVYV